MADLSTTVNGLEASQSVRHRLRAAGHQCQRHRQGVRRRLGGRDLQDGQPRRLEGDQRAAAVRAAAQRESNEIIGWENIELISDRPFETWIDEFKQVKDKYPDRVLIASIMEEYRKDAWIEIVERCQEAGVDAFECNFSCPHGLPERRMGSAMGENPEILEEVCGWVMSAAKVPVWAKMTPNVTHIEDPTRAALQAGCDGISAINTIRSVIGVDLETLRPEPTRRRLHDARRLFVQGRDADRPADVHGNRPGDQEGVSRPHALGHRRRRNGQRRGAVHPAGLRHRAGLHLRDEGRLSLHSRHVEELSAFMDQHNFKTLADFKGHSLQYFTTHYDLVHRQAEARGGQGRAAASKDGKAIRADNEWRGDEFVKQTDALARG